MCDKTTVLAQVRSLLDALETNMASNGCELIKEARELRRGDMTRPPFALDKPTVEGKDLDLAEWENDVVMYSL